MVGGGGHMGHMSHTGHMDQKTLVFLAPWCLSGNIWTNYEKKTRPTRI
jgi:hypothetical protein